MLEALPGESGARWSAVGTKNSHSLFPIHPITLVRDLYVFASVCHVGRVLLNTSTSAEPAQAPAALEMLRC